MLLCVMSAVLLVVVVVVVPLWEMGVVKVMMVVGVLSVVYIPNFDGFAAQQSC